MVSRIAKIFPEYVNHYGPSQPSYLSMFDYELILKLFKYLAPAIQEVNVVPGKNDKNQSDTICRHINEYGSEYITKLYLYPQDDNFFKRFTVPFVRVEDLFIKITQYPKKCSLSAIPFNELFSNVRKLDLVLLSTEADYSFLDCELPHFFELELSIPRNVYKTTDIIERLLTKNPQIIKISTKYATDLVKIIHQKLYKLENLSLEYFDTGNDTLRFDYVRREQPQKVENLNSF